MENNNNSLQFWKIIFIFIGGGILLYAFSQWVFSCGYSTIAITSGAVSALMAFCIYAKFIPSGIDFLAGLHRNDIFYSECENDKTIYPKIFISFIFISILSLFIIYLIRYYKGYTQNFLSSLEVWLGTDRQHYIDIAKDGYSSEGVWDRLVQLVFLPGYPLIIKFINIFVGNYLYSAFLVSIICFALSGCVFYKLLRLDYNSTRALKSVKYMAIFPSAFFFSGAMSESLFLLCTLCCVYMVRNKKWFSGGLFGFYAAFTRSVGIILPVLLVMEYISEYRKDTGLREHIYKILSVVMTAGGFGAYCIINYIIAGNPLQFMYYQKVHWFQGFGWFFNTAGYQTDYFINNISGNIVNTIGLWGANLIAIFFSLIIILLAVKRLRPSYVAWFIAYFFIAIGATWLLSRPRYMSVMFVLPIGMMTIAENRKSDMALSAFCIINYILYLYAFSLRRSVW